MWQTIVSAVLSDASLDLWPENRPSHSWKWSSCVRRDRSTRLRFIRNVFLKAGSDLSLRKSEADLDSTDKSHSFLSNMIILVLPLRITFPPILPTTQGVPTSSFGEWSGFHLSTNQSSTRRIQNPSTASEWVLQHLLERKSAFPTISTIINLSALLEEEVLEAQIWLN